MEKQYEKPTFERLDVKESAKVFFVASGPAPASAGAPTYTTASTSGWF